MQALVPEEIAASKNLGHEALRLCAEYLKAHAASDADKVAQCTARMKMLVEVWLANAESEALRLRVVAKRAATITLPNGLVLRAHNNQELFDVDAVKAACEDMIGGQFRRLFIRNSRLHVEHISTETSNEPMIRVIGIIEDPDHAINIPRL